MKPYERYLLAGVILAFDFVVFVIPLCAMTAAYVLIARPRWFKEWVLRVYEVL